MRTTLSLLFLLLFVSACSKVPPITDAYVKFFDKPDYEGQTLTVVHATGPAVVEARGDIHRMGLAHPDGQQNGNYNDRAMSVVYLLPKGWSVIVYEDGEFQGGQYKLVGTGRLEKIPDLDTLKPPLNQKISSLKWVQN